VLACCKQRNGSLCSINVPKYIDWMKSFYLLKRDLKLVYLTTLPISRIYGIGNIYVSIQQ
jgi:hypothetical protein